MQEAGDSARDQLEGKVVLITGAGRGLGRALALEFARQGAILAVNDLTPINLDETVSQSKALGARVKDYVFDVARKMPAEELVNEVLEDWGRIDIVINHATVRPQRGLLDLDEWDFRRTLDVNLSAAFFMTQLVGRAMKNQAGGNIVYLAADFDPDSSQQESAPYWISKMGLIGLTLAAAKELAPYRICVNAVIPGAIGTGLQSLVETQILHPEQLFPDGQLTSHEPIQAVIDLIMLICRPNEHPISGQILKV